MKFIKFVIAVLLIVFWIPGCSSISRKTHYGKLAEEQSFEHFFPSNNFRIGFSSIDEAYEYVNTADLKFYQTVSNKRKVKGLAAKLKGPVFGDTPVSLICMIRANNNNGAYELVEIDLSKKDIDIPAALRKAADALLFFIICHDDKIVSLSNFYLDQKYSGYSNGNTQVKSFTLNGNKYETEYPVGWGIEKSFQYLRGEIN
jgi:hypothetical protein